jgi:hypothetical protein
MTRLALGGPGMTLARFTRTCRRPVSAITGAVASTLWVPKTTSMQVRGHPVASPVRCGHLPGQRSHRLRPGRPSDARR